MKDYCKGRDVATFDVPGTCLQPEMPDNKTLYMKFLGKFVDIMCSLNSEHKDNTMIENEK